MGVVALAGCLIGARPVALEFEDRAAVGCPGEAELRARVALLLRDEVAFDEDSSRVARVGIARRGPRIRATVRIVAGDRLVGERLLETDPGDCPALMAAVALNLVLAIDPVRGMRLARVEQVPVRPAGAPPLERRPDRPPSVSVVTVGPLAPRKVVTPTWLEAGAYSVTSFGMTPGVSAGASLDVALHRPGWSVMVEARGLGSSTTEHGAGEARASLLGGGAWGCLRAYDFGACGGGVIGAQIVGGDGFEEGREAVAEVAYLGVRGFAEVPLTESWWVRLWVDALGQVGSTRLTVSGETARDAPPVVGAFGLGAVWRFRFHDGNGEPGSMSD